MKVGTRVRGNILRVKVETRVRGSTLRPHCRAWHSFASGSRGQSRGLGPGPGSGLGFQCVPRARVRVGSGFYVPLTRLHVPPRVGVWVVTDHPSTPKAAEGARQANCPDWMQLVSPTPKLTRALHCCCRHVSHLNHTHIHIHTDIHTQTYTHTYTYTCTHTHTHTKRETHTHTHRHAHTRTHIHTQRDIHTDTHTHRHTQTNAQTHTYTHIHTDTHRHTDTHTCTQTYTHRACPPLQVGLIHDLGKLMYLWGKPENGQAGGANRFGVGYGWLMGQTIKRYVANHKTDRPAGPRTVWVGCMGG